MGLTVMGRYSRQELLEGWTLSEEEAGRMRETLLGKSIESTRKPKEAKEGEDCEELIEDVLTISADKLCDEGRLDLKEYCGKSFER